ncbi:MAG: tRNA-splicing ligase RtcB [Rhodospirillaceae bacterium]|nr:MAG: tRNA-splicing ligase RtcB [Rhodospirillaceae bacterium]
MVVAWAELEADYRRIVETAPGVASVRTVEHMGTLGTGNHFIELYLDEIGWVWVMLHSGSRGVGDRIGTVFIEQAKKDIERHFVRLCRTLILPISPKAPSTLSPTLQGAMSAASTHAATVPAVAMGRNRAARLFMVEGHTCATAHVECRKDRWC